MLTTGATVIAGLLGVALILMGVRAFTTPQGAAGFGIPPTQADALNFWPWLRVKGLPRIGSGFFLFVLMPEATPPVLGCYVLPLADIPPPAPVLLRRHGGPR